MSVQYSGDKITFADGSIVASGWSGFKNRIINGDFRIDQRNAGASVTPVIGQYLVDRWVATLTASSKFSAQQNAGSVTPPVGFTNYLGVTSLSAYSVATNDTFIVSQAIEGFNIADLGWGTASAASVTLSFRVYSSLTGTFGGALINSAANRSYTFSYSVPVANTWTTISVTVAGDTTGTWLTTNGIGINLRFGLGSGSNYTQTAGSWGTGNAVQPPSTVSVVGTSGATFYITGVQLEKGSTATSFDYRPYSTELALCQRYYQFLAKSTWEPVVAQPSGAPTIISCMFKVTMRATPTTTLSSITTYSGGTPVVSSAGTDALQISYGAAIGNSQYLTTMSAEL